MKQYRLQTFFWKEENCARFIRIVIIVVRMGSITAVTITVIITIIVVTNIAIIITVRKRDILISVQREVG